MSNLYSDLKLPARRVHVRDAPLSRRMMSLVTDILLLNIFVYTSFGEFFSTVAVNQSMVAAVFMISLITFTYFTLFEYVIGQTPGMMMMGLSAQNATLLRSIVRNIYFIPIFPLPLIALVEPFYLIWRKTRLLEILSSTRTIEVIRY